MFTKNKFYLYDYSIYRFLKSESKLSVSEFFAQLRDAFRPLIWYYQVLLKDKKFFGILMTREGESVDIFVLVEGDRYKISRQWVKPLSVAVIKRHNISGDLFVIPNDYGNKN